MLFIDRPLVQAAKRGIKSITVQQLKTRLIGNAKTFYLIDVREDAEWSGGHLPQAIHLSKGVIERDIEKPVPNPLSEIIVYCGGGSRSALAAENLHKMGYRRVFNLEGGYRAWVDAGHFVVKD